MARALSQLQVTPMVQPLASLRTLTLRSSVRFAAIRAAPPKPRGGRTALAGRITCEKRRAGLGRFRDPKPFLKPGPHKCKRSLYRGIKANSIHGWLLSAPHMLAVRGK